MTRALEPLNLLAPQARNGREPTLPTPAGQATIITGERPPDVGVRNHHPVGHKLQ
jgi:hypothetical protein